jgi:adenosylhomocysteine nucleosidase
MPAAAPTVDASQADIGLVCALSLETAEFLRRCERVRTYTGGDFRFRGGRYGSLKVVTVEAGAGRQRARRAAQALLDAHRPQWLISCGFAGALQPALQVGQIVVARRLVCPDRAEVTIDVGMQTDLARGLHVGTVLTTDDIIRQVAQKLELGQRHEALAVDMESHAVAELCRDVHQRCVVVRVISDDCQADLPAEVLTVFGRTGAMRLGAVFGALIKRPGSASDLWRLREQATAAAERLASFLEGTVRQLPVADG